MSNYNLTVFNGTETSFATYFQFANTASNGFFGVFLILSMYIVMFVSLKNYGNKSAAGAAAFIALIFGFFTRSFGAISDQALFITMLIVAATGVYLYIAAD